MIKHKYSEIIPVKLPNVPEITGLTHILNIPEFRSEIEYYKSLFNHFPQNRHIVVTIKSLVVFYNDKNPILIVYQYNECIYVNFEKKFFNDHDLKSIIDYLMEKYNYRPLKLTPSNLNGVPTTKEKPTHIVWVNSDVFIVDVPITIKPITI